MKYDAENAQNKETRQLKDKPIYYTAIAKSDRFFFLFTFNLRELSCSLSERWHNNESISSINTTWNSNQIQTKIYAVISN